MERHKGVYWLVRIDGASNPWELHGFEGEGLEDIGFEDGGYEALDMDSKMMDTKQWTWIRR